MSRRCTRDALRRHPIDGTRHRKGPPARFAGGRSSVQVSVVVEVVVRFVAVVVQVVVQVVVIEVVVIEVVVQAVVHGFLLWSVRVN
jgi:hypothetical protein